MANIGWNFFEPRAITTPEAAARQRVIADALQVQNANPSNWAEGLSAAIGGFTGNVLNNRAMEAEEAGRASAGEALAGLGPNASFEQISAALSNPWLSPAQSNIGASLMQQNMQRNDPMYQLQLATAQEEYNRLVSPPPQLPGYEFEGGQWWQMDPNGSVPVSVTTPVQDSPLVQVNTGANNDFFTGLSNTEGEIYSGLLTAGSNASRNLAQVNQLEGLLSNSKQGLEGAATQLAGELGFDLGGASGVQAAQALINQMVPAQRQPGSGPMSDADLNLFKQSIPRIINQPGGNELIIQTIKDINTYDMQLAQIVQEGMALAEQTTNPSERAQIRQQMRDAINGLQNPVTPLKQRLDTMPQNANPSGSGGSYRVIGVQ